MLLIGLAGPAAVGKTTLAQALVKHHGFQRASFAAPIKDMLNAGGFGVDFHKLRSEEKEIALPILHITPRKLMQTLGTQWGRTLDPDIWVKLMEIFLASKRETAPFGIVIDDVRFPNEAEMIRRVGGIIVELHRSGIGYRSDEHASEAGLPRELIDITHQVFTGSDNQRADALMAMVAEAFQ